MSSAFGGHHRPTLPNDARGPSDRSGPTDASSAAGSAVANGGLGAAVARHGPVAALGVVVLALLLRIPGLTGWWLNPDEGIYYAILTQERFATFWLEAKATAHPPLYFLILRAVGWLTTDFVWLRSIALLSGCAAVLVLVLVGREMVEDEERGWVTGLSAGLLLAVSPTAIVLSQVIRPYMLLVLLLACALYVVLRYLRRPSSGLLWAYAAVASLAVLLHYSAILGLSVFGAIVIGDGLAHGFGRPPWRRLLAVQAVPGVILVALYFWHLRALMGSTEAQFARQSWLASFMIGSPGEAWLAFVGFHSMLVGNALAMAAALLSLVALAWGAWGRAWTPLLLVGTGFVVAVAGAATELYPFGGSRHAAWLLASATPGLGWVIGLTLTSWRRAATLSVPVVGAVVVAAAPWGATLGAELRAREVGEQVLRQEHVAAMAEILDPRGEPRVVLMSLETYRLLVPLFARERQGAASSPDRLFAHFRWGERDVIVLPGADFAVGPNQVGQPNHLYSAAHVAAAGFGVALPDPGDHVLVLSGGWQVQGIFDLANLSRELGFAGTATSVPGLIGLSLDLEAYGRALERLEGS
jgi:hypothetical protein